MVLYRNNINQKFHLFLQSSLDNQNIYYVKKDSAKILQWIFAVGASMLFASTINTFCHVFTLTETMFLRIATGILFGGVITVVALIINHIGYLLFSKLFLKR